MILHQPATDEVISCFRVFMLYESRRYIVIKFFILFNTKMPTISSLFSKYTYNVALLYPAAFAISSIEVAAIPLSINKVDAADTMFSRCTLLGSFFLRPIRFSLQ